MSPFYLHYWGCSEQPYSNGRRTVGDGASLTFDNQASVLAVCHLQGTDDLYYYSTTFSGGPGVSIIVHEYVTLYADDV